MRLAGALLLVLMLAGCASLRPTSACPAGQERLQTAQLFFGHKPADEPRKPDPAFRKFVDEELTTRFPDGLTILDGGGQWKGEENRQIREAAKVVLIVLPRGADAEARLTAVRVAYKARFNEDAVMHVTPPACVAL